MESGEESWADTGTPAALVWTLPQESGCFPPEFEQLEEASGRGDLPAVEEILKSNWPGGVPGDEETSRLLRFSVLQAIDHDHHHVAAYLLSHGLSFEMEYARRAVEKKSYALMDMLLTHGWDINTQLGPDDPAAAIIMAFDDRRMVGMVPCPRRGSEC
ncbi:hypothetical protein PV04_10416 [Phialophora macrospora]|uniref:Uncharacterized protein n=1 Tax=Phialophora macrospora TaxID=1851006 RepID=A0A0D2CB49_9EURO|nr:hypothetical protein PV04_10416 [Phialophora macrospora]